MTETRDPIEQRVIDDHTEWMREHAHGLRMFETTRTLSANAFGNPTVRQTQIHEMGVQIAHDAFNRGLGLIALSPPQYLVHRHLGAWTHPDGVVPSEPEDWMSAPPPAVLLEPQSRVEIKIEAFGFPIGKREV